MAGRGPTPKDPEKRQRRNAEVEMTEVVEGAGAESGKQPIPEGDWHPLTVDWWDTWAGSGQAALFIDTDWLALRLMLPLVDQYNRNPSKELLGELRLQHAKFGCTPEDRLRLRWRIRKADQETEREDKAAEATGTEGGRTPSRKKVDPRLTVVQGGRT